MATKKTTRAPPKKEVRQPSANKNGKKAEAGSGSSFFTWFMVLALLGVWTSVAVVWFELVDYDDVLARAKEFRYNISEVLQGKLGAYDADGDGDFDVEDARVLLGLTKDGSSESSDSLQEVLGILAEEGSDWFYGFLAFLYDVITPFEKAEEDDEDGAGTSQSEGVQDEKPGDGTLKKDKPKEHPTRNIGRKLKEALKEQLRMIHEKIEAKKIARMALAEVRAIVAKEEAEKAAFQEEELRREAAAQRARERAESKLQEEEEREAKRERIEKEQVKKEKAERERVAKEREEKERVAKEKAEKEREEKEKEERKAKQDKEEKAEKKPPSKKPEKTEVPEEDGRKADKEGKASSKKDEKVSTKDLLKAASKKTSKESDKGGKK